jgi:hypothetical protein
MIPALMLVGGPQHTRAGIGASWQAGLRALATAALAVTLALGACGPIGRSGATSPEELLHGARRAYLAAGSYHLTAAFARGGKHYRLDVAVQRPDARGTSEVDGLQVDLLVVGGRTYRRGQDFFRQTSGEKTAKLVGDNWVLQPDLDLQSFLDPHLLDDLQGAHPGIKSAGSVSQHGYRAEKLIQGHRSLYVASRSPGYLVRVEDPHGELLPGASDLEIDFFDYGAPVAIASPPGFVDLSDPSTQPARFVVAAVQSSDCDRSGCTLKATLRNEGGAGASAAEFSVEDGGAVIDSCRVAVAATAHKASQDISCRISSSAWTEWADAHPGSTFGYRVKPSNPAYE